ncbi:unnamed protein product [Heligmosomoides polygyrus]|uniref:VASP_tetra domain-containing protein n=1 Tax=Heligmosomoides polygyrus TaxID=6339 RepID=A0A183GTG5_HELPZ|nr:unnamed protein product [Heligmosomoides polygyrus]
MRENSGKYLDIFFVPKTSSNVPGGWEGVPRTSSARGISTRVNYYSVFKKKQLQKELDEFERTLKELDDLITQGVPRGL